MSDVMAENERLAADHPWSQISIIDPDSVGDSILDDLLTGRRSIVVLRNILDTHLREDALTAFQMLREQSKTSEYPNGSLTTIGPYLAKSVNRPQEYFHEAKQVHATMPEALNALKTRVYDIVTRALRLNALAVGEDTNHGSYSPFVIRLHKDGVANPLHNDMIARDARDTDLSVGGVQSQLSCIVCLQECDTGGELVHYCRKWSVDDERHKIIGNLGYQDSVIGLAQKVSFKPKAGDIYIMNPTYYHEITKVGGETRVTMGFFFGHHDLSINEMIAWS